MEDDVKSGVGWCGVLSSLPVSEKSRILVEYCPGVTVEARGGCTVEGKGWGVERRDVEL